MLSGDYEAMQRDVELRSEIIVSWFLDGYSSVVGSFQ